MPAGTRPAKGLVDTIAGDGRDRIYWDGDLEGFGLCVKPSGHKSYAVRIRSGRRSQRMTLGPCGVLTPEAARRRVLAILAEASKGGDPVAADNADRAAITVADLRAELDRLETRFPGLRAELSKEAEGAHPRMLPFEVSHQAPVVRAVARAHRKVVGKDLPVGPIKPYCFYGTDAAHLLHRAGMEGIVCGPGGRYNTMPDERVDVKDYLDMIRIYLLAILEICEVA